MARFSNAMRVRMYDTDAAGILYFADQFRFVQDTVEAFFENIGFSIPDMVTGGEYITPTVHAECDYFRSLKAGMRITVAVEVEKLKTTSMILGFEITGADEVVYGRARMVYVFLSRIGGGKIPIPRKIRCALERYMAGGQT